MASGSLPGFRDFYPDDLALRAHIMAAWRDTARRYGFAEYDGPPLEPLELYTRKSGEEIVGQLYNFADKGGREVALRPEMTPTFARMVGARANALRKPVRWFSTPQLFRYERQQRGRLREHFQFNVDIVGATEVVADAELMACAVDSLRALGLTAADVVARVSDRRLLDAYLAAVGVPAAALPATHLLIDKLERQPPEQTAARLAELGLPSAAVESVLGIAAVTVDELAEVLAGTAASELVDRLRKLESYLAALLGGDDGWFRLDLSIVRGLAYYTGMVFELFDRTGEFRAVCGGGRYDDLLRSLGGVDLPALGFGMGDVVLGELLKARGLAPSAAPQVDCWVYADESVATEEMLAEVARLRGRGLSVEYALRPQTLSKQKKAAHAAGASRFVVLPTLPESHG